MRNLGGFSGAFGRRLSLGFTIVELMVGVAIIGVLAAIAIPNYQMILNRSRQKEARMNLIILSKAMKGFWSEHVYYVAQFETIGFNPEGELRYAYGFRQRLAPPVSPPANVYPQGSNQCYRTIRPNKALPNCLAPYVIKWSNLNSATVINFNAILNDPVKGVINPSATNWQAMAAGQINGTAPDLWRIDSDDNLVNIDPQL